MKSTPFVFLFLCLPILLSAIEVRQKIDSPYIFWLDNLESNNHGLENDIYLADKDFHPMSYNEKELRAERSLNYLAHFNESVDRNSVFFNDFIKDNIEIPFYSIEDKDLLSLGIILKPSDQAKEIRIFTDGYIREEGHDPNFLNKYLVYYGRNGLKIILGNIETVDKTGGRFKKTNDIVAAISPGKRLILIVKYKSRYLNPIALLNGDYSGENISYISSTTSGFFRIIPENFEVVDASEKVRLYYQSIVETDSVTNPIGSAFLSSEILQDRTLSGIQIPCQLGTDIISPVSGHIEETDYNLTIGHHIIIKSDSGFRYTLGHLQLIHVKEGMQVVSGQKIATGGSSGYIKDPALFYSITLDNIILNPLEFLIR